MKKLLLVVCVLFFINFVSADEENLFGDTSGESVQSSGTAEYEESSDDQPVTNEDKTEENVGKETTSPKTENKTSEGNKFQQFVNRSGKKALAGVKAGLNISHFWDDDGDDGVGVGYFFGAFFEYSFIKNFSLQAEMNFSDKGDDNFSYEYFEIPVIAQGVFPLSDMIWINGGVGLYVAFAYARPGWFGFKGNTVDGGMIIKSAVEINTKVGVFVADLRYTLGFAEVWDKSDFKNGAFSILAGYAVPLPF